MARRPAAKTARDYGAYALYSGFALLALSGAMWLVSNYFIEGHEGWGDFALDSQFWSLKVHGAGIMVFLAALGFTFKGFAEKYRGKGKATGLGLLALFSLLIISGYLVLYGPSGGMRDKVSVAHWSLGLLAVAAVAAGLFSGKKKSPKRR